jgi:flavin-dependent dehydrogenase
MDASGVRTVAVIGDGPAGTTLATFLARAGLRVTLFSRGRPSALVVGESMVPAAIPILRQLGVEAEVSGYSVLKPGATFVVGPEHSIAIDFAQACTAIPDYAYNVPRERFDATLMAACKRSGVQVVKAGARLERDGADGVRLTRETLDDADGALPGPPDLIVDASGRSRLIPRLLDLPTRAGPRRDDALFAHCHDVPIDREGHVHSDRLDHGWCWRIPLRDRVSVGVVAQPHVLRGLGETPEAQFDAIVAHDSRLRELAPSARRITPVVRYTNYQSTTLRGAGKGWALAGDALGFVDPVFSSGLYLALDSARNLARAILSGGQDALDAYASRQLQHIETWQAIADIFYDGRFFALMRMRDEAARSLLGRLITPHLNKYLPRVFTGEGTAQRYAPFLLSVMARAAGREPDLEDLRIRDATHSDATPLTEAEREELRALGYLE